MTAITPADGYATAPVPYATVAPRPGAKAWAGAAIMFGGLCLVLLGGCFLIGVLGIVYPSSFGGNTQQSTPPLTGPQTGLMAALYVLAFLCFAGATAMLFVGTRGLLRVLRG